MLKSVKSNIAYFDKKGELICVFPRKDQACTYGVISENRGENKNKDFPAPVSMTQQELFDEREQEIIAQFPTTPFIFAGSGITRRYYDLPDWRSLLLHFAKMVRGEDPFALRYYESMLDESVAPPRTAFQLLRVL